MSSRDRFTLTAYANTLVVDLEAGLPDAATTIDYGKGPEWTLWHRLVPDDWIKVPIAIADLDDPKLKKGQFSTLRLKPGQMYEACMTPPGYQPDRNIPVHDWVAK